MKFFKPEDFEYDSITIEDKKFINVKYAANRANEKLEKEAFPTELRKINNGNWYASTSGCELKTHTGLLINIQSIEKCNHSRDKCTYKGNTINSRMLFHCECGSDVKIPDNTNFEEV